jgi:hypothetical protein
MMHKQLWWTGHFTLWNLTLRGVQGIKDIQPRV